MFAVLVECRLIKAGPVKIGFSLPLVGLAESEDLHVSGLGLNP